MENSTKKKKKKYPSRVWREEHDVVISRLFVNRSKRCEGSDFAGVNGHIVDVNAAERKDTARN